MDRPEKHCRKDKKVPRVPIKTYRWEDVRRARRKGGYPWTYLYKHPFKDFVSPYEFIIMASRRAKKTSTEEAPVKIQDEEVTTIQVITEPDDAHSMKETQSEVQKSDMTYLEPADSQDNISQYLEQEEPVAVVKEPAKTIEELQPKRKLSAESRISRISQTKLQIMKKLRDAKQKIKGTKLSLPIYKNRGQVSKRVKNSPPKAQRASISAAQPCRDYTSVKPIYIHIPLKGDASRIRGDSFNQEVEQEPETEIKEPEVEIEEKEEEEEEEQLDLTLMEPEEDDKIDKNEEVLQEVVEPVVAEVIKEDVKIEKPEEPLQEKPKPKIEENDEGIYEIIENPDPPPKRKMSAESSYSKISLAKQGILKKLQATKQKIKSTKISLPVSKFRKPPPKKARNSPPKSPTTGQTFSANVKPVYIHIPLKPPEGQDDEFSYLEFGDKKPPAPVPKKTGPRKLKPEFKEILDNMRKQNEEMALREAELRGEIIRYHPENEVKEAQEQPQSSTEPERKRKLSVESSHSRKSLSKTNIVKTLKDAGDKINQFAQTTLKKAKDETKNLKKHKKETNVQPEAVTKKPPIAPKQPATPVYLHIPLKPPEGASDEFSHLEFGAAAPKLSKTDSGEQASSQDSPASPEQSGVQFIFLTAPSDDEILDGPPEIPETPSSDNNDFFGTRLNELKELAKDVVDEVSPESRRRKLTPLKEETKSISPSEELEMIDREKLQVPPNQELQPRSESPEDKTPRKVIVDEEDGLKMGEGSPVLKKKVSFKRRSKDSEEAAEEKKAEEEEKCYLDEKIVKSSSLEDNYNKWSKLSDHEYEPVNPPAEDVKLTTSPAAEVTTKNEETTATSEIISTPIVQTSQSMYISLHADPPAQKANSTSSLDRRLLGGNDEEINIMKMRIQAARVNEPARLSPNLQAERTPSPQVTPPQSQTSESGTSKFQKAFKNKAGQFKTKLQGIKRPSMTLPHPPKFQKPNMPNFQQKLKQINLPKMPNTPKINMPSFSLPRTKKRSLKQRQLSTESNAGDDSKKPIFDFSTYPRIFKKKPQASGQTASSARSEFNSSGGSGNEDTPVFATVPRANRSTGSGSVRVPLHAEDSIETTGTEDSVLDKQVQSDEDYGTEGARSNSRETSLERRMASHGRYDEDIDNDDMNEYERENQEINRASPYHHDFNSRWNHGHFVAQAPNKEFLENIKNSNFQRGLVTDLDSPEGGSSNREKYSSEESSLGMRRRGVLEEINSDEFFLRQKGISQDNIEMGRYLSSEIREAFRQPINALSQMEYDRVASNQSLPETPTPRVKPVRKPKRRKTPHASEEQIKYESEGEEGLPPPSRPKRRSRKISKKQDEDVIPYQETISVDTALEEPLEVKSELSIISGDLEDKAHSETTVTDSFGNLQELLERYKDESDEEDYHHLVDKPPAPPRRQKSLKSLTSEQNSTLDDSIFDRDNISQVESHFDRDEIHEYIVPEMVEVPIRPARVRSRTRSHSRGTSLQPEEFESYERQEPCIEEPCTKDLRDSMGYAIIDKQKPKDPPLPPPRTPPRRRRSLRSRSSSETKFFTTPRPLKDEPPSRPVRNYSTLTQSRPSRKKSRTPLMDDKENVEIEQYIEIDDRDLQLHSGEVIQKMRDRPLPAPPRPPRKTRLLKDITSQENIMSRSQEELSKSPEMVEETEVSTQTDVLPEDLELRTQSALSQGTDSIMTLSRAQTEEPPIIERRLITPTHYTHQETVTHAALVVQPLNGAKILPDHQLTREKKERIIPIAKESDWDETSEIPEKFHQLKSPEPKKPVVKPDVQTEVEVLRAQKLQVSDLDVDRLTVNELMANKIIVSEIDSANIQVNEISSKTGSLKVGEIELPPSVVHELYQKLRAAAQEEEASAAELSRQLEGQKKTSTEDQPVEIEDFHPQRPPRKVDTILVSLEDSSVVEQVVPDEQIVEDKAEEDPQTAEPWKPASPISICSSPDEQDIEDLIRELRNEHLEAAELADLEALKALSFREVLESPEVPLRELEDEILEETPARLSEEVVLLEAPQRPPRLSELTLEDLEIERPERLSEEISLELQLEESVDLLGKPSRSLGDPQVLDVQELLERLRQEEELLQVQVQEQPQDSTEETKEEFVLETSPERPPRLSQQIEEQLKEVKVDELIEAPSGQSEVTPELEAQQLLKIEEELLQASEKSEQEPTEEVKDKIVLEAPFHQLEEKITEEVRVENLLETPSSPSEEIKLQQLLEELRTEEMLSEVPERPKRHSEKTIQKSVEEVEEEVVLQASPEAPPRHSVDVLDSEEPLKPPRTFSEEAHELEVQQLLEELRKEEELLLEVPARPPRHSEGKEEVKVEEIIKTDHKTKDEEVKIAPERPPRHLETAEILLEPPSENTKETEPSQIQAAEECLIEPPPDRPPRQLEDREQNILLKPSLEDTEKTEQLKIQAAVECLQEYSEKAPPERPPRLERTASRSIEDQKSQTEDGVYVKELLKTKSIEEKEDLEGVEIEQIDPQSIVKAFLESQMKEESQEKGPLNVEPIEPEVDEQAPPRPPQPVYMPSQPPASFYALKAQKYVDELDENIPVVPRRRRHAPKPPISRSTSEESSLMVAPVTRRHHRQATTSSEPSITQLSGQLVRACGAATNNALKRLMTLLNEKVTAQTGDVGQQDLSVVVIVLLVLIAGLILLGLGNEKTVVHLHHWEYFNPPRDS